MGRPQIKEVDYHDFVAQLRKATDKKCRIEKKEKEKWAAYVKLHQVLEPSCFAYARSYGSAAKPQAVIIQSGGSWDGYYVYSDDDMFCLKFVPGDPPPAAAAPQPEAAAPAAEAPAAEAPADPAPAAEAPTPEPTPEAAEPEAASATDAPVEPDPKPEGDPTP